MNLQRKYQGSAEDVPLKCVGSTKEVTRKWQGSAKIVMRKCQESTMGVWTHYKVAAHCNLQYYIIIHCTLYYTVVQCNTM